MSEKKNTSAMTDTHIKKSIDANIKVDPDKTPNIMYFGGAKELDHLDTPAFLAPYRGIAQLFSVRKDNLITSDDFNKTIFKYKEWEDLDLNKVKDIMGTVEVYHNNGDHPDREAIREKVEGYIHYIDVSKIKDQLIEVENSSTDKEVLYIGKDPLPIKKVEKIESKVICKYKDPNEKKNNNGLNESRVQFEGFCDENGDEIFTEASHGNLKFSFRLGINIENGHKIKVVFDLNPNDVKQIGSQQYTTDGTLEDRRILDQKQKQEIANKIKKTGHNDFSSQANVKAIVDMDTKNKLNEVQLIGVMNNFLMDSTKMVGEDIEIEWRKYFNRNPKPPFFVKFWQNSVKLREIITSSFAWKNELPRRDISKFYVGQMENIGRHNTGSFKSTKFTSDVFGGLMKNVINQTRNNNTKARGVITEGDVYEEPVQEFAKVLAVGGLVLGALIAFLVKIFKGNSQNRARQIMDKKVMGNKESPLKPEEIKAVISELVKGMNIPIVFIKNYSNIAAVTTIKNFGVTFPDIDPSKIIPLDYLKNENNQVIIFDVYQFRKQAPMKQKEDIEIVFKHEIGHIKTSKKFFADKKAVTEYMIKVQLMSQAAEASNDAYEQCCHLRCYYELPVEKLANQTMNVDVEKLCGIVEGYKTPDNWQNSPYYHFIQETIPIDVCNVYAGTNPDLDIANKWEDVVIKKYFPKLYKKALQYRQSTPQAAAAKPVQQKVPVKQEAFVIQEADIPNKRKQIQDIVIKTFNTLDPTGINAKKYQDMFAQMNDNQFKKWIEAFLADHKSGFRWDIEEFGDGSRTPKFENIDKAAKGLGISLFEYVYIPHVSSNPNRPIRTKQPVLVGKLSIKRPQQFVSKKTNLSLSDTNRDDMTGVVKGDSKAGTSTGIENELLEGVGGNIILQEIIGARADNQEEYANMIQQIAETGSVNVQDIKTSVYDKGSLLKADLYLMAMGIKTNLISDSYYSIEKVRSAYKK